MVRSPLLAFHFDTAFVFLIVREPFTRPPLAPRARSSRRSSSICSPSLRIIGRQMRTRALMNQFPTCARDMPDARARCSRCASEGYGWSRPGKSRRGCVRRDCALDAPARSRARTAARSTVSRCRALGTASRVQRRAAGSGASHRAWYARRRASSAARAWIARASARVASASSASHGSAPTPRNADARASSFIRFLNG